MLALGRVTFGIQTHQHINEVFYGLLILYVAWTYGSFRKQRNPNIDPRILEFLSYKVPHIGWETPILMHMYMPMSSAIFVPVMYLFKTV